MISLSKRKRANVCDEQFWSCLGDKLTACINIDDYCKAWDIRCDIFCNLLDIAQTIDTSDDSARVTLRFPPHINYLGCDLSWTEESVRAFLAGALRWDLYPGIQPQPGSSFIIINIDKIKDYGDTAIWQASQFWSRDI